MNTETFALIFVITIVIFFVVGLIYFIIKPASRRKGNFNAVTFYGATAEFHTKDQKEAIEHVLDIQADKKMEEQESGDSKKEIALR
ncbi:MAG: hypothetical protein WAR79_06850 [Melioribacteraceae bacterium]